MVIIQLIYCLVGIWIPMLRFVLWLSELSINDRKQMSRQKRNRYRYCLDNAIHTGRSDYVRKKENSNGQLSFDLQDIATQPIIMVMPKYNLQGIKVQFAKCQSTICKVSRYVYKVKDAKIIQSIYTSSFLFCLILFTKANETVCICQFSTNIIICYFKKGIRDRIIIVTLTPLRPVCKLNR